MDQNLLSSGLAVLLVPITLGIRRLRQIFAMSETKPTIPEGIIQLLMLACGMGLAFASWSIQKAAPTMVTDFWFVQGILFYIAILTFDVGADATSTKTATASAAIARANANTSFKVLVTGAFLALLLGAASSALADTKKPADRISVGAEVSGQWLDSERRLSFVGLAPAVYATYNAAELVTLATSEQWDVTHGIGAFRLGARTPLLAIQRMRVYAGVDAVYWHGPGTEWIQHKLSPEVSLAATAPLLRKQWSDPVTLAPHSRTLLWLVGRASLDPQAGGDDPTTSDDAITGWRLALRYQFSGGVE